MENTVVLMVFDIAQSQMLPVTSGKLKRYTTHDSIPNQVLTQQGYMMP